MKILIELPNWLGDTVMATPAIENLLNHYVNAEITLIGSFASIELLKNHPKIFKTKIQNKKYISLYRTSKDLGKFDIFLCFRGSLRSRFFKLLISSRKKYQFNKSRHLDIHQVEKYNQFVNESLGVNYLADKLILYPDLNSKSPASKPIVGVNPGASYGNAKRWYPEEFAKVITALSHKYKIVIFGGPSEKNIANDIESILIENNVTNYENLAGKTSISELVNIISSLDLFITGDSGPMHIAANFQIPTVAIFGPTKDHETSQWMNKSSIIVKKNLDCQPCMKRKCPLRHHNCMKLIKASEVLTAISTISYKQH